jgi:hypothetical protein
VVSSKNKKGAAIDCIATPLVFNVAQVFRPEAFLTV